MTSMIVRNNVFLMEQTHHLTGKPHFMSFFLGRSCQTTPVSRKGPYLRWHFASSQVGGTKGWLIHLKDS